MNNLLRAVYVELIGLGSVLRRTSYIQVHKCTTQQTRRCAYDELFPLRRPWSKKDVILLKDLRSKGSSYQKIGDQLGRTAHARRRKIESMEERKETKGGKWSVDEDEYVRKAVVEAGELGRTPSWTDIGRGLRRTAAGVQLRSVNALRFPMRKGSFTTEEDRIIVQRVKEAEQERKRVSWWKLGKVLGRPSHAVQTRWAGALREGVKKGRWTAQEDQHLAAAVDHANTLGDEILWTGIGRHLSRPGTDVRSHWYQVLSPTVWKGRFSEDEDKKLTAEARKYLERGEKPLWSAIGRTLCRSSPTVSKRWRLLERKRKTLSNVTQSNTLIIP